MPIYWTGAYARPCADAAFKSRCSGSHFLNVAGRSSRTLPLQGLDGRGPVNASERGQQSGRLCSSFHPRAPPVSSMLGLGKMRAWRSRRWELKAVFSPFGAGRKSTYFQQAKPAVSSQGQPSPSCKLGLSVLAPKRQKRRALQGGEVGLDG